jgi:hypothetical protein
VHPRLLLLVHVSSRQFHLLVYNADNIWKLKGRKYFSFTDAEVTPPQTQILLYAEKNRHFFATNTDILLRHQHRNYSATNRDIIPPTTKILLCKQPIHQQILLCQQNRYRIATSTDIILPATQILHCNLQPTQIFTLAATPATTIFTLPETKKLLHHKHRRTVTNRDNTSCTSTDISPQTT